MTAVKTLGLNMKYPGKSINQISKGCMNIIQHIKCRPILYGYIYIFCASPASYKAFFRGYMSLYE